MKRPTNILSSKDSFTFVCKSLTSGKEFDVVVFCRCYILYVAFVLLFLSPLPFPSNRMFWCQEIVAFERHSVPTHSKYCNDSCNLGIHPPKASRAECLR
mmetsp:Transcript_18536/g.38635  ORF Transcript_18536/g.38635 Transcript_18536/m.38635 type:complete len:99 (+) Transcript_18536:145-441(+)